jgi:hypothetical protein
MSATVQHVPIGSIKPNPNNPRTIRDERFHKLVQSIKDFPEMLELRPIVTDAERVVLGGNMRLKACKAAGLKTVPVVVADHLTEAQRREFIVKDNVGFGDWDWDALANEWQEEELTRWGVDIPELINNAQDGEEIEFPQSVQLAPTQEYIVILAEPNSLEWEDLKTTLRLGMVRRGGYKPGSPFESVGLERVIPWNEIKVRLGVSDAHRDSK